MPDVGGLEGLLGVVQLSGSVYIVEHNTVINNPYYD